jgi:glycosyltransferase involved in cell wall biosynthesis
VEDSIKTNCDILFLLPSLGTFGGVENSIYRISDYYHKAGKVVVIMETEGRNCGRIENFPSHLSLIRIKCKNKLRGLDDFYKSIRIALKVNRLNPKIVFISHERLIPYSFFLLKRSILKIQFLRNDHKSIYQRGLLNNKYLSSIVTNNYLVFEKLKNKKISNLKYIPNGVAVKHKIDIKAPMYDLLFVGRLVHESKGIFYLPEILNKIGDKSYVLHIVGDGPDKEELIELFQEKGLIENVIFHGILPHEKVNEIMSISRILIFTSFYEGLPNVLLEAMACSVVPFVFELNGVTDGLIDNGVNGFVFKHGDSSKMADSIKFYLENRKLLSELGGNCKEMVEKNFSIDAERVEFLKLLNILPNTYFKIFDFSLLKLLFDSIMININRLYAKCIKTLC